MFLNEILFVSRCRTRQLRRAGSIQQIRTIPLRQRLPQLRISNSRPYLYIPRTRKIQQLSLRSKATSRLFCPLCQTCLCRQLRAIHLKRTKDLRTRAVHRTRTLMCLLMIVVTLWKTHRRLWSLIFMNLAARTWDPVRFIPEVPRICQPRHNQPYRLRFLPWQMVKFLFIYYY